ncbi:MAG TPA: hypothetical protein VF043_08600 [Ktedonobacteraceae bacterium]
MRFLHTSSQGRPRYILGAVLAIVLIAAIFIIISRLGGTNHTVPAATTPTPGDTGLTKGATQGRLTRIGNIILADLPTTGPASTLPYSPGSAISTQGKQAAQHAATDRQAPRVTAGTGALSVTGPGAHPPGLIHNFNGLNAVQDLHLNGYDYDPPDQGLCANASFVVEEVNLVFAIYHHDGSLAARPVSLNRFFGENLNEFTADTRCYFDPISNLWISTLIAVDAPNFRHSHMDVAVRPGLDPTATWTIYRIDTTDPVGPACPCFADNDRLGADQFGVYLTQNEFNISALANRPPTFNGSHIYAISKSQLVALKPAPYFVSYAGLTIGGMPADALQPALTRTAAPAEFFLSSLYRGLSTSNHLGVWALTNQQRLNTNGIPALSSMLISSEVYGHPPLALQKGSNAPINTGDSRMQDVTYSNGVLWASLNSVVNVGGETVNRSGVAWFAIGPQVEHGQLTAARMEDQGYIGVKSEYLLYGALTVNGKGQGVVVMALAGPDYFPGAVYTTFSTGGSQRNFSPLHLVAPGAGPAAIGTCLPQYGGACAWGDYSATALVDGPQGSIWLATEYIPGGAATHYENWGTRILEITPAAKYTQ